MIEIELIPCLKDNYAYLLVDDSGTVAVLDPSEPAPVLKKLEERGLTLDYILNTHHHGDHTGGNAKLKDTFDCKIIGPAADAHRIPSIDEGLKEGDRFTLGNSAAQIFETPGHTSGHIVFWFKDDKALFSGDTLFSMGCGRLFEGTPEQMWSSMEKLNKLPDDAMIYCGHEYTENGGNFCLQIEPDNEALKKRMTEVKELRANDEPTIPVSLGIEKQTNAFLRAGSVARFAEIRLLKDSF